MPKKGLLMRPQGEEVTHDASSADPPAEGPKPTPKSKPAPKAGPQAARGSSNTSSPPSFSIFTYLDGVWTTPNTNRLALEKHLEAVDEYLLRETSFSDRRRYTSCPEGSRMSLYTQLKTRGLEMPMSPDGTGEYGSIDNQIDLFNVADVVFSFFLPFSTAIPTASKFWGALGRHMEVSFRR